MRRPALLLSATLGAALLSGPLLAGCTDAAGDPESPAAVAERERQRRLETWPLTGLRADGSAIVAKKRPALVVKMDNTPASAPQAGLSQADLVVEELVEGGSTRLAAFFYQSLPDEVGPVRSMRASDLGIIGPAEADVVTSGAAPATIARIQAAGIRFLDEESPGFYRDPARTPPYDLMTDLTRTAEEVAAPAARPPDYLTWGSADDLPRGRPAPSFSAVFSSGHTTAWRYERGGYVEEASNAPADDRFPTDTVLVLRVRVGDAGYLDPAGNTVPETDLEGSGAAVLMHGGRQVRARWTKSGLRSPIVLTTGGAGGPQELAVPAGHVWIELVPVDGGRLDATS